MKVPDSPPLLEVSRLEVYFEQVRALDGVSLEIKEGEFVVLLGANGAGKTTTLRAISGLVRPSRGEIWFGGRRIERWPANRVAREGIGHVPEGRRIFPDHTVLENLQLGGYPHRRDRRRFQEALDDVFVLFPRLADRRAQEAGTLSGGESQMLAIARALMTRPRLLMLDEPSLGLAPQLVAEMFSYLSRLHREQGITILLVEQAAAIALRLADRGYVLETGRVALAGTAKDLSVNPQVQHVYLGAVT